MVEPSRLHQMLDELRFDEAERLLEAGGGPDKDLREEIRLRRAEAEQQARDLRERIVRLGGERRHLEIIELAGEPVTRRLLELLPDSGRKSAEAHLRGAERWEQSRRATNTRRLAEARRAFEGLDLELSRGLMNRLDTRFLSDAQVDERDRLLLEISARSMELESIEETGRQLIENTEPGREPSTRPWWRRWLG